MSAEVCQKSPESDLLAQGPNRSMDSVVAEKIEVGLLTGGSDRPYVFGLAMALAAKGICLDVIGSDIVDRPELHAPPLLNFLNLRGNLEGQASVKEKAARVLTYYARLIRYAAIAKPKIFHILWKIVFKRSIERC